MNFKYDEAKKQLIVEVVDPKALEKAGPFLADVKKAAKLPRTVEILELVIRFPRRGWEIIWL